MYISAAAAVGTLSDMNFPHSRTSHTTRMLTDKHSSSILHSALCCDDSWDVQSITNNWKTIYVFSMSLCLAFHCWNLRGGNTDFFSTSKMRTEITWWHNSHVPINYVLVSGHDQGLHVHAYQSKEWEGDYFWELKMLLTFLNATNWKHFP